MVPQRLGWLVPAALALVALAPCLLVTVPGMADLPNHIARHHILAFPRRFEGVIEVHWRWIGNLGVDLPVVALAPLMGAERATRFIVALIAPLGVIGVVALGRAAHGRMTAGAMIALPFVVAQPYFYGFANYCLSVALALLAMALWLRLANRPPSGRHAIVIALMALLIWTAHVMGWAVLAILAGGAALAEGRRAAKLWWALLPICAPLAPMLVWRGGGGPLFSLAPDLLSAKIAGVATMLKGIDKGFDLAMMAAIAVLAGLAIAAAAGGRRIEPRLGIGAGLLWGAAALLPTTVLGSWGADLRLFPVAALVSLMAIGPAAQPSRERLFAAMGVALFGLRIGVAGAVWCAQSQAAEARLALLDHVPKASRMGFVNVAQQCGAPWRLAPDRKFGAYAVVRRDVFTNTLFQIPGADIAVLHQPADRRRWFDGSQDVQPLCPGGGIDAQALAARINALAGDGFVTIWVAGVAGAVPVPAGWRVAYHARADTLLAAQPLRATRIAPNAISTVPATRPALMLSPSNNVPAAKVMIKPSPTNG